jgi:hypothetical protein
MKREQLIHEIQALDLSLAAKLPAFRQQSKASVQALEQVNPLWFMGAGFITGLATGQLGWRSAYTVGALGFQLQSMFHSGLNHFMGAAEL